MISVGKSLKQDIRVITRGLQNRVFEMGSEREIKAV